MRFGYVTHLRIDSKIIISLQSRGDNFYNYLWVSSDNNNIIISYPSLYRIVTCKASGWSSMLLMNSLGVVESTLFTLHKLFHPQTPSQYAIRWSFFVFLRQKVDMPASKHIGSWSPGKFVCQVKRRFHSWELDRQPFPWDLGISPPSSSSLGSSRIASGEVFEFLNFCINFCRFVLCSFALP
jgi:hypothetical protein